MSPTSRHYLRGAIAEAGAEVRLGHAVTAREVVRLDPDAVVVATGGRVAVPAVPGSELPHVYTGPGLRELLAGHAGPGRPTWERLGVRVLAGRGQRLVQPGAVRLATRVWMPLGRRVAIVGGDLVALELAEFLAARGRLVTILEGSKTIAPEIGNKRKTEHMGRLDRLGVAVHVRAEVGADTSRALGVSAARRHASRTALRHGGAGRFAGAGHRALRTTHRPVARRCGQRGG
ncbi:MAG TPA: FAD-dependent oxidoreductase [Mycobacterium sp.]|nr:FAD-dependent oxidoreductase [Mycobacterium sp.]